jgi:hypothetical protein
MIRGYARLAVGGAGADLFAIVRSWSGAPVWLWPAFIVVL